jgi:hypothetical protein
MRAKWKSYNPSEKLPFLIIEAGPSITEVYHLSKHYLQDRGVLILGIDGPSILDSKDKESLLTQLNSAGIPFRVIDPFVWILPNDKDNLFDKTDFGKSGDTCFFLEESNLHFKLSAIPRIIGFIKNQIPKELTDILENVDARTVYITNEIPDMLIVTKDKGYLDFLYKQIEVEADRQ